MKEFFKYYFDRPIRDDGHGKMWFTLNYTWLFGSLLFIGLFLRGALKYNAPIFYFLALIPFMMMIYNFIDEYQSFKLLKTGSRSITAQRLMYIFYGICALILFALISILIINEVTPL